MKHDVSDLDNWMEHHVNVPSRVLYLGNAVGDSGGGCEEEGINHEVSRRFIQGIQYLDSLPHNKNNNSNTIIINSVGGVTTHGFAIYDSIRNSPNYVVAILLGQASSMASIIALAADYVIISPNSYMMIHEGETSFAGAPGGIEHSLQFENKFVHDKVYQIYFDHMMGVKKEILRDIINPKMPPNSKKISMQLTLDHIKSLCRYDCYFTAEECVQLKFANRTMEKGDLLGHHLNEKMI